LLEEEEDKKVDDKINHACHSMQETQVNKGVCLFKFGNWEISPKKFSFRNQAILETFSPFQIFKFQY